MTKRQTTRERVELNTVVRQLAAKDRPAAVAILEEYGALVAPEIKTEDIPAVIAAFRAALKKFEGVL